MAKIEKESGLMDIQLNIWLIVVEIQRRVGLCVPNSIQMKVKFMDT